MILYHFTSTAHLPMIVEAGFLKVTDPNLFSDGPMTYQDTATGATWTEGTIHGQPVVWLLDLPEAGTNEHGLGGSINDKSEVRITVDVPDAQRWVDWIGVRPHDAKWTNTIIRSGGGLTAAKHWWIVTRPIPAAEWKAIDVAVYDDTTV